MEALPDLKSLLKPFRRQQREALTLRLIGLLPQEIAATLRVSVQRYYFFAHNPAYKGAEQLLLDNKDYYAQQATDLYMAGLQGKSIVIINNILSGAIEGWRELKSTDKRVALEACKMVLDVKHINPRSLSYEELLSKARHVLGTPQMLPEATDAGGIREGSEVGSEGSHQEAQEQ